MSADQGDLTLRDLYQLQREVLDLELLELLVLLVFLLPLVLRLQLLRRVSLVVLPLRVLPDPVDPVNLVQPDLQALFHQLVFVHLHQQVYLVLEPLSMSSDS